MLNGLVADYRADQVPQLLIGKSLVIDGVFVAVNLVVGMVGERKQIAQFGKSKVHLQQLGQCHVDLFVDHGNGFIGWLKNRAVIDRRGYKARVAVRG
jgi:hypothetical protein